MKKFLSLAIFAMLLWSATAQASIYNAYIIARTQTSLTVQWASDIQDSTDSVQYTSRTAGVCGSYVNATSTSSCSFGHTYVLTGLLPNTTYCVIPYNTKCTAGGGTDTGPVVTGSTSAATMTITPTFSVSPTKTPTRTASPTSSITGTYTRTSTPTHTPTATSTRTISATVSISPTFTITPSVTPTNTPTYTRTMTGTRTRTVTVTSTRTITMTTTPTPTTIPVYTDSVLVIETKTFTFTGPAETHTFTMSKQPRLINYVTFYDLTGPAVFPNILIDQIIVRPEDYTEAVDHAQADIIFSHDYSSHVFYTDNGSSLLTGGHSYLAVISYMAAP